MPRLTGLRAHRERLALKQEELAGRAGIHRITVSKAERGFSTGLTVVNKLAAALQVAPHQLFLPESDPEPPPTSPQPAPPAPASPAACPRSRVARAVVAAVEELLRTCDAGGRVRIEMRRAAGPVATLHFTSGGCSCCAG